MAIKVIIRVFYALCACLTFATTATAFAQAPTPYHPGQTISFTVTFEGVDAGKLLGAQLLFRLTSPLHEDQPGFDTIVNVSNSKPAGPDAFEASIVIPASTATGTYRLERVSAGAKETGFSYTDGLPALVVTVENPARFIKPAVKGIKETSRP
jgi:hypothetical protein